MVSQLPLFDTAWPMKNSRKFRDRSDQSVRCTTPGPEIAVISSPGATPSEPLGEPLDEGRDVPQPLELLGREPVREGPGQELGARVAAGQEHPPPGAGHRDHGTPAVLGIGAPGDEAARLQSPEGRAHRLRADLLELGQLGRRRRTPAVETRQRRDLGQGRIAADLDLPETAPEPPDAQQQGAGGLFGARVTSHIDRLVL
jgi:hypothetical protein